MGMAKREAKKVEKREAKKVGKRETKRGAKKVKVGAEQLPHPKIQIPRLPSLQARLKDSWTTTAWTSSGVTLKKSWKNFRRDSGRPHRTRQSSLAAKMM